MVYPDSSVGKEFACKAGDPGSIPGSGRSPGEGIGYPLQYSWASLMAQLVKNTPAIWETWDQSLGWEDPLEKGKFTHSSILAWRILWTVVHGVYRTLNRRVSKGEVNSSVPVGDSRGTNPDPPMSQSSGSASFSHQ